MSNELPPPVGQQSFQMAEDDLATLERTLPQLADALMPRLDNRLRSQLRQIQRILSDVRWRYGPAANVKTIPVNGD